MQSSAKPLSKQKVAIVGANGYSGLELARLLLKHPMAELSSCFARDGQWNLGQDLLDPRAKFVPTSELDGLVEAATHLNAVFLATPAEVSLELAPALASHTRVIDLSGAFRLSSLEFEKFYQLKSPPTQGLKPTQYGLVPWSPAREAVLVSNPGCYATSCLMALIPLLRDKLIDPQQIVIDAKSGTTGAGRKAKENILFSEVAGECLPYKIGVHQHLPEIKKYASFYSGQEIDLQLTTHLLPIRRGIISSIYLKRHPNFSKESDEGFLMRLREAFNKAYKDEVLVRFGEAAKNPKLLSLKAVVGSARTHLSYAVEGQHVFVFSCIDNLLKGAAGQAIENWNSLNSWPTSTGLEEIEGVL